MPDLVRLRYVGDHAAAVPTVGGDVQPDQVVDVPGRVLTDFDDLKPHGLSAPADDCFLVELGNPPEVRAFQRSLWRDETPAKTTKSKE